jgi:Protein of unknown function (DUF551)
MSEWISIKDRLPENGQKCLCYCETRHFDAEFHGNDFLYEFFILRDGCPLTVYASHWMPLPEPPK